MAEAPRLPHYHAYLLRYWAEPGRRSEARLTWRFSLEDPRTGVRHGFADLPALIAYVEQTLARDLPSDPEPDGSPDAP